MNDRSISDSLNELTKSVNQHRVELAGEIATLNTTVAHLSKSNEAVGKKVEEIGLAQAGCPARTGWPGANARIGKLEKKTSSDKINPGNEMSDGRDDHTGNVDEAALAAARVATVETGINFLKVVKIIGPWIAALFIGIGIWIGTRDSDDKDDQLLHNVRELGIKIEQIEKRTADLDPNHLLLPTTEEILQ